jgi:hypothetical protein
MNSTVLESLHPTQTTHAPTYHIESTSPCVHHCRVWLAASGLSYGRSAREAFARAHPALFGRAYDVTLRGYERWRLHDDTTDSVDAFARYLSPRHNRWLATVGYGATLAPCLFGGTTGQPCWSAPVGGGASVS